MVRTSCRDKLLQAAEQLSIEQGGARLTLDSVAERAGVSKGGLMYHFPTKEALLAGMVEKMCERIKESRTDALARHVGDPAADAKAEVEVILERHGAEDKFCAAMLAVTANQPELMGPIREQVVQRFEKLRRGNLPFEPLALLTLAADGLFLLELLQLSPFSAEEHTTLRNQLMRMIDAYAVAHASAESGPSTINPEAATPPI